MSETPSDIGVESEVERRAIERETPEERERKIEELRSEIKKSIEASNSQRTPSDPSAFKTEEIRRFQEKYLPPYLQGDRGVVSRALTEIWVKMSGKCEVAGSENIPAKGPYIIICNHFGGGDVQAILQTFKHADVHFGVAKGMWWDTSAKWFLKKVGMIPVEESLFNLTEQEKEEAMQRQGENGKKVFKQIIDKERGGGFAVNTEFIRQAVAVLSRGHVMAIFPEGLWLRPEGIAKSSREHKEMKQGYRGIELVASLYQRLTGEELPIVPTAYIEEVGTNKTKLVIDRPLTLSKNDTGLNGTDWAMSHVAYMLPEEQRGYYGSLLNRSET